MGTKYSSNSASGFDATPPADDGTVSEANKVKYSTIKNKLATPVKDLADAINSDLTTHFDHGPTALTANTTLGASHYEQFIQVSGSGVTLTLSDAATLGAGWNCWIVNTDASNSVTLGRATGVDTINGSAANATIPPGVGLFIFVIAAANGFRYFSDVSTIANNVFTGTNIINTGILPNNLGLAVSVGSSAMTIALKGADGNDPSSSNPVFIPFRNVTAGTGTVTRLSITAANSLVISSGSTLGTTSGALSRIWIVGFNDAGTFRLGAINCATSTNIYSLTDDILSSSTAEGGGGAADSAGVIYTGTAVTSKAMRILGYVESTQATAGTWATSPSKVQLWTSGMKLPGDRVQTTITTSAALASTSTQIPVDDTSPQNTEGAELMTRSITPVSAANLLIVQVTVLFSVSDQATGTVALFQDNNANALAVVAGRSDAASTPATVTFTYFVISGTASSTTFKVRGGPGSAHTFYFNGSGGNRLFNGVAASSISITEVSV